MPRQGRQRFISACVHQRLLVLVLAGNMGFTLAKANDGTTAAAATSAIRRLPQTSSESKTVRRLPHVATRRADAHSDANESRATPEIPAKVVFEVPPAFLSPPPQLTSEAMAEERRRSMVEGCDFEKPMTVFAPIGDPSSTSAAPTAKELQALVLPPDVERRARGMLDEGTELANRGAIFAAHEEFLRVMRLVAQSLDAALGRPFHAEALAAGLRALDEAQSFGMKGKHAEADIYLAGFIAGHQTPVLKSVDPGTLTPLLAMQRYYEYAFAQLGIAGNDEKVAADALYALGRIESLMAEQQPEVAGGHSKAMALYQSALAVNGSHSRAANELGVLLARSGRLREAKEVFAAANQRQPIPMIQQNLRGVESQLAQESGVGGFVLPLATSIPSPPTTAMHSTNSMHFLAQNLQLVDPATFNAAPDRQGTLPPAPAVNTLNQAHPPVPPASYPMTSPSPSAPSLKERIGSLFSP